MTHRHIHQSHAVQMPRFNVVAWVNIALIAIAVASLIAYVVSANAMAAQTWHSSDATEKLGDLLETRNGLIAQQSALEDRAVLSALAAEVGMVPAGAVVYLVQDQPVAAR